MKQITSYEVENYADVLAVGTGREPVAYQEYGSYQGDYLAILKDEENLYVYKGSYGSCSGCDWLESERGWDSRGITKEKGEQYAANEKPFLTIPLDTLADILERGTLPALLPANTRSFEEGDSKLEDLVALLKTVVADNRREAA